MGRPLSNSFTSTFSALHGSEDSGHNLQDYDTVQSSIRGQNFEGMCLYDKVRRNIIVPTSTLNMWHCAGSVHRYLSTRMYCVTKQKPNTLSITLCQMGIRTPPAYLHTTVLSSKALLRTLMLLRVSIGEMWPKRFLHRIIAALWEAALSMSVPAWKSHLCGSTSRLDR